MIVSLPNSAPLTTVHNTIFYQWRSGVANESSSYRKQVTFNTGSVLAENKILWNWGYGMGQNH